MGNTFFAVARITGAPAIGGKDCLAQAYFEPRAWRSRMPGSIQVENMKNNPGKHGLTGTYVRPRPFVLGVTALMGLALAAGGGPNAAAAFAYVVPAIGWTECTTFSSGLGQTYTVTVSGVYVYDVFTGRAADAFYRDPDGVDFLNPVTHAGGFLIDGAKPPTQAFHDHHTYVVSGVAGTGMPFCFTVWDVAYGDNAGALVVQVNL